MVELQRLARHLGLEAELFAEHIHPAMTKLGRDFRDYATSVPDRPDDLLMYQTAIGSTVADFVGEQSARVVVNYHNITPERFFVAWEPSIIYGLRWGRSQLASMAGRAELGIAVSRFNEGELIEIGYRATEVVPVLVDLDDFERDLDREALDRLRSECPGAAWLFVGRVVPNKAQHDLVKAFALYRRLYDPRARLRLVGGASSPSYANALERLIAALDLEGAVELTGEVPSGVLAAHYGAADVLICLSEHEGFCVPLLEAMYHRVPIVAFAAAAVPETLGEGGLCLAAKSPALVAAAVQRVVSDESLRQSLVRAGSARLAAFDLATTRTRMAEVLERLGGR